MKRILLYTLLFAAFTACKKDDDDQDTTTGDNNNPPADTKYELIEIKTDFGDMHMWLYDGTPLHKANFLKLAKEDYFDGTTFHRIVTGFVIQGGDPNSKDSDPNNDGKGGPPYKINAEIDASRYKHVLGAVGAARQGDAVNPERQSNGSQFYIVINNGGTAGLDGAYTVFGEVFDGIEVAQEIVKQPKNSADRPLTDIKMDVNVITKTEAELKAEFNYVLPE